MQYFLKVLVLMSILTDSETIRFRWSSEQGFDTSCGYSTAAALMDIWWNITVTEEELIAGRIASETFNEDFRVSFRTLSQLLISYGFITKAYKMDWEQLRSATVKYAPVLVHFDGYMGHFALVLGITDDIVIIADPAEGTRFVHKGYFTSIWSGNVLLVIHPTLNINDIELARAIEDTTDRLILLERTTESTGKRFR